MIQLGINAVDGSARHDWRDFQAIKNQLAGEECEAFELYPAESRLMDPSNYFSLWCFPGLKRIKVGNDEPRRVFDADESIGAATWLRQMIALLVTVGLVLLVCLVEAYGLSRAHSRRERDRELESNNLRHITGNRKWWQEPPGDGPEGDC